MNFQYINRCINGYSYITFLQQYFDLSGAGFFPFTQVKKVVEDCKFDVSKVYSLIALKGKNTEFSRLLKPWISGMFTK